MQRHFNPIDFGFIWTADGWYTFDRAAATKAARAARDAEAKERTRNGQKIKKWSSPNSLISRGGIGSGRPHIEEIVTVFGFDIIS